MLGLTYLISNHNNIMSLCTLTYVYRIFNPKMNFGKLVLFTVYWDLPYLFLTLNGFVRHTWHNYHINRVMMTKNSILLVHFASVDILNEVQGGF